MFNKEKPAQSISSEAVNQAEATEQENDNSEKRKKALKRILTRSALMVGVINAALLGGAKVDDQFNKNSKAPASLNMESNTMDNVEEQDYYTAIQTPDDYVKPELPSDPVGPDMNDIDSSTANDRDHILSGDGTASYFKYNTPDNQGVDSSSSSDWQHIGESEMTSLNHEATVEAGSGVIENEELTELNDAYIPPVPPSIEPVGPTIEPIGPSIEPVGPHDGGESDAEDSDDGEGIPIDDPIKDPKPYYVDDPEPEYDDDTEKVSDDTNDIFKNAVPHRVDIPEPDYYDTNEADPNTGAQSEEAEAPIQAQAEEAEAPVEGQAIEADAPLRTAEAEEAEAPVRTEAEEAEAPINPDTSNQ